MTRDVSLEELRAAQSLGWAAREAGGDYLWAQVLADGRGIYLMPLFGGSVRLGIGPHGDSCLTDVWDYSADVPGCIDAGWRAALGWDGEGEPEGWYRHHRTARRRPDGTPASEYVQP
jgi:hypothetical protein